MSGMEKPEEENIHRLGCQTVCPLSQIPATVWKNLLKPPFRKCHPFIFWILLIVLVASSLYCASSFLDNEEIVRENRIALVRIDGTILDSSATLEWVDKLARMDEVKGILVRVNSPGGGAAASQEIYYALKRVGMTKPVCVSMGATAASGGLMISMAGKRIFASPSTITGSIGVRMDIPQLQGLMEKIGVGQETLTTGAFKDAASWSHPLTNQDRAYLQGVIDDMHSQFVEIVANNRHMDLAKARELSDGKIYTGQQALHLGLIDALGGQDMALEWLASETKIPADRKLLEKPKNKSRYLDMLLRQAGEKILGKIISGLFDEENQPLFRYQ